jgi:type II secretory pathway pseudopilin PulG
VTLRARLRLDQGESLIEIVLALAILGIAAVAITTGLLLSAKLSDVHRKQTTASAFVRNYAEFLENTVTGGGYVAGAGTYPAYSPGTGFTASVTKKQCWSGSAWASPCTAGNDLGVQQLTLQVASTDTRASERLVVVVRKPCTPSQATCS